MGNTGGQGRWLQWGLVLGSIGMMGARPGGSQEATDLSETVSKEDSHARAVVVLLMDDVAYSDLGCHGNLHEVTPHMDQLASEGVRFNRAYATAATCSPSRAAIFTGRYQQRSGHEFNPQHKLGKSQGLASSEVSLAKHLGRIGFHSLMLGKWHLGYGAATHPMTHGFQEFYGFLSGARSYRPYTGKRAKRQNELNCMYFGREPVEEDFDYLTTELGRRAVEYIQRQADKPFFLCVSFSAVHAPLQVDPELTLNLSDDLSVERAQVLSMLASMDQAVGKVLAALKTAGREKDTVVVLLSDNGGTERTGVDNWDLIGKKGELMEGGVRVPMILRWPAGLVGDRDFDANVSTLDLVPTAIAACGGTLPGNLDGVDLVPHLRDEPTDSLVPHPVLYWRQGEQWALLAGDHKIVDRGAGPFYRNLSRTQDGLHVLANEGLDPELTAQVDQWLTDYELWANEMRSPKWRKYTLKDEGESN